MNKFFWLFGVLTLALLPGGCRSPEKYQEMAVQRAREYLLKKAHDLTTLQREYVKFNKPWIMSEQMLGPMTEDAGGFSPEQTPIHFCISWVIPGKEEVYMVYGVSTPSMAMWFPERLIIKNFVKPDKITDSAVKAGRTYGFNTLQMMTLDNLNRMRFTPPEIVRTDFGLSLDAGDRGIPKKEAEALLKLTQNSLVWNSVDNTEKIVVIGLGQPDLANWKPYGSMVVKNDVYEKHLFVEAATGQPEVEEQAVPKEVKKPEPPKTPVEKMLDELDMEKEAEDE